MAVKDLRQDLGLWNIGTSPAPEMSSWGQYSFPITSSIPIFKNADSAPKKSPIPSVSNIAPPSTLPTPQPSGLTADVLRSKFGFNDSATINNILSDPGQRSRYEREMSGGQSGQDPYSELYSNSLNALTDSQKMFEGQAVEANKGIDEQAALARSAYDQALTKSKEVYATQTEDLGSEQRSLQSESIRAYNALKQQGMTLYGGGSSTGGAISELIGQQFIRTSGQLREKYMAGVKVIQSAERDAVVAFNQAIQNLEQSILQGRREINQNLAAEISNINMQKAQVEDTKSSMRAEAARVAMGNAQALQNSRDQKLYDLGLWKLQRDEEIGRGSKFLDDLAAEVATNLKFQKQSMQGSVIQPNQFFSQPGQFYSQSGGTSNNANDPYAGLINKRF